MGRNRQASFAKRKREQARQQRAAEKRARRKNRAADRSAGGGNSMDDGLDAAPQFTKPTDDEVMRAVERAMNPGKMRSAARANDTSSAKLFVGNVDYRTSEDELRTLFVEAGFDVVTVSIGRDRTTGESRGFAFIELATPAQAGQARDKLDGASIAGRELRLSEAREGNRR